MSRTVLVLAYTLLLPQVWLAQEAAAEPAGLPSRWNTPSKEDKDQINGQWLSIVSEMWDAHSDKISFCLGDKMQGVADLLLQSFPAPLPSGPADDLICSNSSLIDLHLCGPEELMIYYKYILVTDNIEKIPSNQHCDVGRQEPGCAPGFFSPRLLESIQAHSCCPGYFCPVMLTCMIPCPLGAYCPRSTPADPPAEYLRSDFQTPGLPGHKVDKWCKPYGYKARGGLSCGGANKWTIFPQKAFPMEWEDGSGDIYCPGGSYCPDPVTTLPCEAGHFCKHGSADMTRCPPLVFCPPRTEAPRDNYTGITLDALLFLLIAITWNATRLSNRLMQRLSSRERLRVAWGRNRPTITVVQVAPPRGRTHSSAGSGPGPSASGSLEADSATAAGATSPLLGARRWGAGVPVPHWWTGGNGGCHAAGPVWVDFEAPVYELLPGGPSLPLQDLGGDKPLQANSTLTLEPMAGWPAPRGVGSPVARQATLNVTFECLGLRLRSCGKVVLAGVSAGLRACVMTAIMGPSGAGKTSLLSALAGKAPYGMTSGTILVNGRKDRLERYKRIMGFVPQDDIMHRSLTVEENMMFSARFRLPAACSHAERLTHVEHALQVLGLADVRHQVIGDEETRGISGGQRKRVNVGLELVADPALLFLDEPTSGLDSTASKLVVQGVQRVALSGVTVAAVIHQPSCPVFRMFDDVILLAKGGRTAYYGPQRQVQEYFESLGYPIPSHMNLADALLDIISRVIRPQQDSDTGGGGMSHVDVSDVWEQRQGLRRVEHHTLQRSASEDSMCSHGSTSSGAEVPSERLPYMYKALLLWALFVADSARDAARQLRVFALTHCTNVRTALLAAYAYGAGGGGGGVSGSMDEEEEAALLLYRRRMRVTPGFWHQAWWCLCRAVLSRTRQPMQVITEYAVFVIIGSFLGFMSDHGHGTIQSYTGSSVYSIIALGMMNTVTGLKTFGRNRIIFDREAARGLNKLAYFCAHEVFDWSGIVLRSVTYMTLYYSFAQPRAVIWQMYVVTIAIAYCCTGIAYLLSLTMEVSAAQLSAAVLALICALLATKMRGEGPMRAARDLSYARWALEGFIIAEANRLNGVWLLARCMDLAAMRYNVTHFWHCLRVLLATGLAFRAAACLCLYALHRNRTA